MLNSFIHKSLTTIPIVALLLLGGCSSDDGGPAGTGGGGGGSAATQGVFLDSAVEGLEFSAGGKSGVTNAAGTFDFDGDKNVTFSVGSIAIGTTAPLRRVTPIDVVANATSVFDDGVTNVARFLQTIDDDGNPANGIAITQAIRDAAAGKSVDFGLDAFTFGSDTGVQTVIADLTRASSAGERALIDAAAAQTHLQQTIISSLNGTYSGEVSEWGDGGEGEDDGPVVGSFSFTVTDGVVAGTARIRSSNYTITGSVDDYGDLSGQILGGGDLFGKVELDVKDVTGGEWVAWGNYYGDENLSFSGTRQ